MDTPLNRLLSTSYHILGQSAIFTAAAKACRKVEIGVEKNRKFSYTKLDKTNSEGGI